MEKVKLHTRMYGWKHVWMEFAEEFQASVNDPNPDSSQTGMNIMVPVKNSAWVLVYAAEPAKGGNHGHTTVETSYSGSGTFKFAVHPQKRLDALSKLLGMQDIIIGDKNFDPRFVVKGNNVDRVRALFINDEIRALMVEEPTIEISVHPNDIDLNPSPKLLAGQQCLLSLKIPGIVDDFERLKSLYRLVELLLTSLCAEDVEVVAMTEGTSTQAPSYS
jgi:hypothetical protein